MISSKFERRVNTLQAHLQPKNFIQSESTSNININKIKSIEEIQIQKLKDPQYVLFGWKTIPDGTASAVWDSYGSMSIESGPQSLFLFNKSIQENLPRYTADPSQYLVINHKDGTKENIPGPSFVYFDPSKYESIIVMEALTIEPGMAVFIYEKNNEKVEKRIVHGPTKLVLKSNQWIHRFFWNVPDQRDPRISKVSTHELKKIRTIPDQLYFNVENVRTLDDALLSVNLMIFFCLKDIEKMFEGTHDPVSDLINSVTADIIDFASQKSFENFKKDSDQLNQIKTYSQLFSRASKVGYDITKVVFRGYGTSPKLQDMHNSAIESRTQIRLRGENETETQNLEDFKLEKLQQRKEKEREIQQKEIDHKAYIDNKTQQSLIERKQREFEEIMRQKREEEKLKEEIEKSETEKERTKLKIKNEEELEYQKKKLDLKLNYYKTLSKDLNVDITKVIIAEKRIPEKMIQISSDTKEKVAFHVNE